MTRGWHRTEKISLSSALLRVARVLRVCAMHPIFILSYGFPACFCTLPILSGICFYPPILLSFLLFVFVFMLSLQSFV